VSKHSKQTRKKIAESVRLSHLLKPRTADSLQKMRAALILAHKEGRAGGFKKNNKLGSLRKVDSVKKAAAASKAVCLGSHGFGCMERGLSNHLFAKQWQIKSPEGKSYRFTNLLEWCRRNQCLFGSDDSTFKAPLWDRVAAGLSGKSQWYGWRVVEVGDIDAGGTK
jgi:hypothetical protein